MSGELALLVVPAGRAAPIPVLVEADPNATAGQLLDDVSARAAQDPGASWLLARTGEPIRRDQLVGELQLRHGDRLEELDYHAVTVGPGHTSDATGRFDSGTRTAWRLLVVGGPLAGTSVPLAVGERMIGRSPQADLVLDDAAVSARHVALSVTEEGIWVRDLGSTNGTLLDGQRLSGAQPWVPGSLLEVGSSLVTVSSERPEPANVRYADGQLLFNRPPRVAPEARPAPLALPAPPTRPAKNKFPLATAILPLILGVVMVKVNHQIYYLLICLLSPLMAVGSAVSDRRSGRHQYRKDRRRFDETIREAEAQTIARAAAVTQQRRRALPSPAHLVERAMQRTPDLWERRPADPDFLTVRVGLADQPSWLEFAPEADGTPEPPPGDDPDDPTRRVERLRERYRRELDVPVAVPLAEHVLGIAGSVEERERLARAVLVQAAVEQSPRDLAIVALVPEDRRDAWRWLQWLPHVAVLDNARTIGADPESVRGLLAQIDELVASRKAAESGGLGIARRRPAPAVLLLVAGDLPVSRPQLAAVLADGPSRGVTAVVLAETAADLPGECQAVVTPAVAPAVGPVVKPAAVPAVDGGRMRLVITTSGEQVDQVLADGVSAAIATQVALALAPLRDVSAGERGADVPSQALLVDLAELPEPNPEAVRRRWERAPGELRALLGAGPGGVPVELDLRRDGPHALVAGTTGAGKSELLQTLVASLALAYPPSRVTFVLIDYKGGAAFSNCIQLPHVVGFFTDLDGHLARRALESLNAELRRREAVLRAGGAKDLLEMEQKFPDRAPASLLLVIDEFAFLRHEVPEFVDGVIDVSQRGRSLGVHLVLATQRPSGVVDEKIRSNSTIRVALRVADDADSTDVIGRPDAARIAKTLPGRAYARTGHSELRLLQTAYVGARRGGRAAAPTVRSRLFEFAPLAPPAKAEEPAGTEQRSDLQRLVAAIVEADHQLGLPPQPRPWLDPLASTYDLEAVAQHAELPDNQPIAVLGVIDEPAYQRQRPYVLDLAAEGGVAVYGAGGTGKTTLLRTMAASLASRLGPEDLRLYGVDCASRGLLALEALPHCGGVVTPQELERVDRLFAMLSALIDERREQFGRVGVASLGEYRAHERLPWVVVLLDGLLAFRSAFENVDNGELVDRLPQLISDGRSVGVHFAVTAERRAGMFSGVAGALSCRVVLRMADPDEYAWLGLAAAARGAVLPPGRGFVGDGVELQVCVLGSDPTGRAQSQQLEALGRKLAVRPETARAVPRVEVLPERVTTSDLEAPVPGSLAVPLGLDAATRQTVFARLDDVPSLLIAGPDQSGRSETLRMLAEGLLTANPDLEAYLLAPLRRSYTGEGVSWKGVARGVEECAALATELSDLAARRAAEGGPGFLVAIDDGAELGDTLADGDLEAVARRGREAGVVVVGVCDTHAAGRAFGGWVYELRKAKHGLLLRPEADLDGDLFWVRLPRKSGRSFPPGRGYLVRRGDVRFLQVASGTFS